jgi:hypothetical protein
MATRQAFYQESLAESSTTNQNWVDKCVCTFTPDSNSTYWILASWSHTSDATASQDRSQTRLYSVESAVAFNLGEMRPHELTSPQDYINAFALGKLTFGASPAQQNIKIQYTVYGSVTTRTRDVRAQTFRAEYKTGTASVLAWVGDARILALRLDKFDNAYFASNSNVQATTAAAYQDMLTLTQTPQAVDHAIIAISAYNPVSTTISGYAQALQRATSLAEVVKESQNTAGYQYLGIVSKQPLAATSTTWKWQTKTETAGTTVNADELAIAVLQLGAPPSGTRRRYMALGA